MNTTHGVVPTCSNGGANGGLVHIPVIDLKRRKFPSIGYYGPDDLSAQPCNICKKHAIIHYYLRSKSYVYTLLCEHCIAAALVKLYGGKVEDASYGDFDIVWMLQHGIGPDSEPLDLRRQEYKKNAFTCRVCESVHPPGRGAMVVNNWGTGRGNLVCLGCMAAAKMVVAGMAKVNRA